MATNEIKKQSLEEIEEQVFSGNAPDRLVFYLDYWKAHQKNLSNGLTFQTGLNQLDSLVEGFQTGELIIITGPTGNGKTLLADSIGQRLMRMQNARVAWFSYEVPTQQMIKKYVHSEDAEQIGLYVPMELKAGSFDWIKAKCLEARIKYGCRVVIIDHLHFIVDMDTKQNMSLNIGAVMRQIKHEIAKAMDMVVFVLAHQGIKREGEEPSIDNIRDSSFISQESDMVFVVYRTADPVDEIFKNNAKLKDYPKTFDQGFAAVKIEKARRSGVYKKRLSYQKQSYWLEEV